MHLKANIICLYHAGNSGCNDKYFYSSSVEATYPGVSKGENLRYVGYSTITILIYGFIP